MKNFLPLVGLVIVLLTSCNGYKKITYLRGITDEFKDTLYLKEKTTYRLQPADILYIRISSNDPDIDQLFNISTFQGTSLRIESGGLYIIGHEVSDSGFIALPIIDKVYVEGLSVEEAKNKIELLLSNYIKDPFVILKLSSFAFTIIGEVRRPGLIEYGSHELSILEAVALGGDITYNGNREKILILRSYTKGTEIFNIDLTDKNIIASEAYYIQPNDIIYITPLKSTLFRVRVTDYTFLISTVTATLTLLLLVLNLAK